MSHASQVFDIRGSQYPIRRLSCCPCASLRSGKPAPSFGWTPVIRPVSLHHSQPARHRRSHFAMGVALANTGLHGGAWVLMFSLTMTRNRFCAGQTPTCRSHGMDACAFAARTNPLKKCRGPSSGTRMAAFGVIVKKVSDPFHGKPTRVFPRKLFNYLGRLRTSICVLSVV